MNWFPCQTSVSFGSSMWTTDSGTKTASLWKVPHLCKHGSCLQITALLSFLESNTAGSFQNSHGSQFWQIAVCSVYKNAAACNTKQRFWSKLYWGRKKFKGKMHTLHVLGYTPLFTCWKHWHYLHGANKLSKLTATWIWKNSMWKLSLEIFIFIRAKGRLT